MVTAPEFAEEAQAAVEARAATRRARVQRGELTPESGMGSMDEWRLDLGPYQLYLAPLTGEWLYLDPVHQTIEPTGYRSGDAIFGVLDGILGVRLRHRPAPAAPMPFTSPAGLPPHGPPQVLAVAPQPAAGPPAAGPPPSRRPRRNPSILRLFALLTTLIGLATTGVGVYRLLDSAGPSTVSVASASTATSTSTATPTSAPTSTATAPRSPTAIPSTTSTASTTAAPSTMAPPSTTAPAVKAATCRNRTVGYSVVYPADWHVAAEPESACQYFNPTPFQVPQYSDVAVAIAVYEMPDNFATATSQFTQPGLINVLWQKSTTVAGHRALRILYRDQGETGTTGAKNYEILVDHNHHTLALAAHAPFSADFAATQRILNAMAASLTLT